MRVSLPTRVVPRSWTLGSMMVSAPTSTSLSMTQVSGIKNRDPFVHQLAAFGHAHVLVDLGQLGASVATQHFVGIAGLHRDHALPGFRENRSHIGEIELAVMIVGVQFVDVAEQRLGVKGVKAGVDLVYFLLRGRQVLLLDDGLHVVAAGFFADDSSVSSGIFQPGGEDRHRGLF